MEINNNKPSSSKWDSVWELSLLSSGFTFLWHTCLTFRYAEILFHIINQDLIFAGFFFLFRCEGTVLWSYPHHGPHVPCQWSTVPGLWGQPEAHDEAVWLTKYVNMDNAMVNCKRSIIAITLSKLQSKLDGVRSGFWFPNKLPLFISHTWRRIYILEIPVLIYFLALNTVCF